MKRFIIFIFIPILMVGQESWAKDQPGDLSKSPSPSVLEKYGLSESKRQTEMGKLIFDVIDGRTAVKPSMVSPEIFDKIYYTEKRTQEFLAHANKEAELIFRLGQVAGIRDILYIVGILPEFAYYSLEEAMADKERLQLVAMSADRMRLITAMLLLLNYKESNPIPPGDIVQAALIK